ncbi:hypothetical protein ACTXT7_005213 [Hymenolepis weldensis]
MSVSWENQTIRITLPLILTGQITVFRDSTEEEVNLRPDKLHLDPLLIWKLPRTGMFAMAHPNLDASMRRRPIPAVAPSLVAREVNFSCYQQVVHLDY